MLGNIEDDLIVIMGFQKDDTACEVGSLARYFSLKVPTKTDADSLIVCLQQVVGALGPHGKNAILSKTSILETKPILISGGTNRASVNFMSQNGIGKNAVRIPVAFLELVLCS